MATEIKAEEKAKELIDFFKPIVYSHVGSQFMTGTHDDELILKNSKICAKKLCQETIDALNSIKGMGKIHKVKFWKLVKEKL